MFFCLPIVFGCNTKIKPDPDQQPRICPKCHNAAVFSAKSRKWFELFWVPLVPMNSKHIWMCSVCQWNVPFQQGWEPAVANVGYQQPGSQQQGQYPPHGQHYQPNYLNQHKA